MSSSPNIKLIDALRKFRFVKKISLDAGNNKSEEGQQEDQSSGKANNVSGGDLNSITSILDMKKKFNRILSDSEGDLSDNSVTTSDVGVRNKIKSEDHSVKKGSLDVGNTKSKEGQQEDQSSGKANNVSGKDLNSITSILDMKKKFSRILSDSDGDVSDNSVTKPKEGVRNVIISEDEEENDADNVDVNETETKNEADESEADLNGNGIDEDEDSSDDEYEGSQPAETCAEDHKSSRKKRKKAKTKTWHIDSNGEIIIGGQTTEEKALMALIKLCPNRDPITLQDFLLRTEWNVEAAAQKVKEEEEKRKTSPVKRGGGKRRRIEDSEDESSDSSDGGYTNGNGSKMKKRKVYDSDSDEEEEISNDLSGDKGSVFEFFCHAKVSELQLMAGCSKKKADIIENLRPFANWSDLVCKLESTSQVSASFLNGAQEVLLMRSNVEELIEECLKLSRKLEKAVASEQTNVIKQPELLSKHLTLSDYQLIGLNWLTIMHRNQLNAILADEMGLGKTIQIIAFFAWLKEHKHAKAGCPHLIVVPAATLDNWNNEIARWCPSMKVQVYHGSQDERRYIRLEWIDNGFGDTDIILATYNVVSSTNEEKKFFCRRKLHYAVFDEAHMLKNMATKRYKNLIGIKASSRILLTGTPLQNNLLELMSLCVFLMPKMFDGKEDCLKFFSSDASSRNGNNDDLPEFERKQISHAKDIIKPFVLRRLKDDVLKNLPTKTKQVKTCPMLPDQKEKYNELIADFTNQARSSALEEDEEFRDTGMTMYMKLRRLANHPLLLRYLYGEEDIQKFARALSTDPDYKDTKVEYIVEDLAFMSDFDIHQITKKYKSCRNWGLKPEDIVKSGKFAVLDELLPKLKEEGHRVLFFSQFVIVLDIVEEYMQIRGHKYLRLDGSTPVTIRQDLIDEYNRDHSIFLFLISTRAGGLGINLTSADTVVIHDIDSNPHNDKQAEDRSHRIGQTRPVTVIRLLSEGTIEENIHQMGLEKLKLEREVSNTEENESSEKKSVASLLRQVLGLDKDKTPLKSSTDS